MFGFQKLDVYRCAVRFLGLAVPLAARLPRGFGPLADQLRRAALSISLNIAEGSGAGGAGDARRFYGIARGSALECAAMMDALVALEIVAEGEVATCVELLDRVVAMLTVMLRDQRKA